MKFVSSLFFLFLAGWMSAQNTPPSVTIASVSADEVAQTITVNYSIEDADSDTFGVWVKIAADGGEFFEVVSNDQISGDVGDNVIATQGSLTWDYSNFAGNVGDVRFMVVATDYAEVSIADMVAQVDEAQLLAYLTDIIGERHYQAAPDHLEEVRNYIATAFNAAGLSTEDHDFMHANTPMRNVIGRLAGMRDEAVTYLIDGHFDGVPGTPGADDNGSAVAGVLEALRILSQYHFEHSLRFIGFDAEELGLIGSLRYVQNGIKPYEEIAGVLNYEMIGYYDDAPNSQLLPAGFDLLFPDAAQAIIDDEYRGNFITVVGNTASNPLIAAYESAAGTYVPELRVISVAVPGNGSIAPDLRRSDHARFWDGGFQALMLTDGADFRNFNYHTPDDVIETLDFTFMANVVKATLATAAELAIPISAGSAVTDLDGLVAVTEHSHDRQWEVKLFPNPGDGLLSVVVTNSDRAFRARLEVYDLSGRELHSSLALFTQGTSGTRLDLRHLAEGSYILVVNTPELSRSTGFVVKR